MRHLDSNVQVVFPVRAPITWDSLVEFLSTHILGSCVLRSVFLE